MTDARISSIYRSFKPFRGMFEVIADDKTFSDDEITSITITRGNASPHPSFTPSTVEIGLIGAVSVSRDTNLEVNLVNYLASAIAASTPHHGATVLRRFKGRKALAETTDHRWGRNRNNGKWETTLTGASWTSLLTRASRGWSPYGKTGSAVVSTLKHPDLEKNYSVTYSSLNDFDSMAEREEYMVAADMIAEYADKLHTLIQHQRNGNVRVASNISRHAEVMEPGPVWTLPRAHTLSPAKWSSPAESATTEYTVHYATAGGATFDQRWPISDVLTVVPLRGETIDIGNVIAETTDYRARDIMMRSINNYTNWARAGVESVTLDLGALWRTGTDSAKRTVTEALRLEEGAPIHLGADWPMAVRGPYFANQITEKITPDSWQITLDLFHARYVVGLDDDDIPTPQPIIWDAADINWNSAAGPWN